MFTLDQVRSFVAVAEELHFGRAADRLHMTQPPLSRQIQKLEKSLGLNLFIRHPRGVSLSVAGEAFLIECRRLLLQAERAPHRAKLIASGQVGSIRLAYTAASAYPLLGRLLAHIKDALPGIAVELVEMVSPHQLEGLRNDSIDIGLTRPPFPLDDIESTLLLTEALVVAAPADHPLSLRGEPVSASELQEETFVMHSSDQARYFRDLVVQLIGVRPEQISHTASQVLTQIALSATGHGLSVVPESAVQLAVPGVNFLSLRDCPPDIVQLHATWLSTSTNPAVYSIANLIQTTDVGAHAGGSDN